MLFWPCWAVEFPGLLGVESIRQMEGTSEMPEGALMAEASRL